jgi:branched-subunit amino acid transport protein AzlD
MKAIISAIWQFIADMHSSSPNVSWTRWMGTLVIGNIMGVWTITCFVKGKFEEMPLGLASVIATMMLGKVGQAVADRNQKKDWRAKEGIKF